MNANAGSNDGHLDELALDALRAGEGSPEDAAHAENCPRCRAALAGIAQFEAHLKAAQPHIPEVPQDLEYRIFRAYRDIRGKRGAGAHPSLMRRWALPAAGLAAAAAVTLTLRLAPPGGPEHALREQDQVALAPRPSSVPPGGPEAPNAAAVDIVDAFRLARALRDGRKVAGAWDADGSGAVDGADVQALARRAVAL